MEYTWLSISVYCDTAQYNRVLAKGIFPVVNRLQSDGLLRSWFFEFNYNGGSNIVTPMLIQNSDLYQTVQNIANDFKLLFLDVNLHCSSRLITINDLYRPFPVNTLQFGLYSVKDLLDHPHIELKQIISEVFIEAVCDEPIQDEFLVSFGLYLLLASIKADFARHRNPKLIQDLLSEQIGLISLDEETCKELDNLIVEIMEDIEHLTDFHRQSLWFGKWENVCQSNHAGISPLKIFQLVNQLLQMSLQMVGVVTYLTRKYIALTTGQTYEN